MRLFVAINLPEEWKRILALPEASIGWLGRGVKWVEPRGMHLTLKFLGEVEEHEFAALDEALSEACTPVPEFEMRIHGTGTFPNPKRPRIYWAGLAAPPVLMELQERIERVTEGLGFPREDHPFRPHLTLARIKEPIGKERMTEALRSFALDSEPCTVREVVLMQSHLSAGGAHYEAIRRYALAPQ